MVMPQLHVYLREDSSLARLPVVPALEKAALSAPGRARPVPALGLVFFVYPVIRYPVVEDIETGAWNENWLSLVVDDLKIVLRYACDDVQFACSNRW